MNVDIGKLINNVSQVKLKGGIFAKASIVIIIVAICMVAIAVPLGNVWVSCGTIGLVFILAFVILMRLINFANKNPQAAILEGAEFLVHEQIQMAAKGMKEIPNALTTMTEDSPIKIDSITQKEADQPDEKENGKEENDG
jgi:membrane protein implicated in regulation of membrane protease activity